MELDKKKVNLTLTGIVVLYFCLISLYIPYNNIAGFYIGKIAGLTTVLISFIAFLICISNSKDKNSTILFLEVIGTLGVCCTWILYMFFPGSFLFLHQIGSDPFIQILLIRLISRE